MKSSYLINGFNRNQQNCQWHEANGRHPHETEPPIVRVNSLKKHHGYTADEAWEIVRRIENLPPPLVLDNSKSLGEILHEALRNQPAKEEDANNYVVSDLEGTHHMVGKDAKLFVTMAEKMGIPRSSYRVYVEVSV